MTQSMIARFRYTTPPQPRYLFPSVFYIYGRLPCMRSNRRLTVDIRQGLENILLLCSLGFGAFRIKSYSTGPFSPDMWLSIELGLLVLASLIYCAWTRVSWTKLPKPAAVDSKIFRPASPRLQELRESRRSANNTPQKVASNKDFGYVWMTVPKNYRNSAADGILTGLLGGPLIVSAVIFASHNAIARSTAPTNPLPAGWLVEQPKLLHPDGLLTVLDALLLSRQSLLNQATLCSTILLVHVCSSWFTEDKHRRKINVPEGEVNSVPRKEGRRAYLYILFTVSVTLWMLCVRIALKEAKLGIWQNLSYFEVVLISLFYQFALYAAIRLAHHGFTLGELGLVCFGATVLFMEMVNLTYSKLWPQSTPYIKTFRLPTPLLIYQIALIPGSLITGALLSPLLYLSRHIAQRPVRRLRYPEQKLKHRRLLAIGFYVGTLVIVGGLIGLWTRWCLDNRDPWLWMIFWMVNGKTKWSRPALLAYWAALCTISVFGWNRQLARSRRYRHRTVPVPGGGEPVVVPYSPYEAGRTNASPNNTEGSDGAPNTPPANEPSAGPGPLGLNFPNLPNLSNLPNLPNGANMSNVANDWLDAADKRVPTLSVNARRKFFHGLAVVMFLPGVAIDPAFTHLSFSAAFALFTFAEYVRYFALYPMGASVHLFMNEFLDQKDSGTAILSHFYLLTGCAGSVWIEGPRIYQYTGILVLGVGDALASIVGKRLGRHRWLSTSPKTLEGSAAFTISIVVCAWLLRVCGLTEEFSIARYTLAVALSAALEAFSVQNDNLTLPFYMWSLLVLLDV